MRKVLIFFLIISKVAFFLGKKQNYFFAKRKEGKKKGEMTKNYEEKVTKVKSKTEI